MLTNHLGEIFALLTALLWTASAIIFESVSRKIDSMVVNLMRLAMALVMLSIYTWVTRGFILPFDATFHQWFWLLVSGIVGFVFGDLFLFQAFATIGSRISMLIMSMVPPLTAILGLIFLGERMSLKNLMGMAITLFGIALVVLKHRPTETEPQPETKSSEEKKLPVSGIMCAVLGAIGQAVGMVTGKLGLGNYNAFSAAQIRLIAGVAGFTIILGFAKKWPPFFKTCRNKKSMSILAFAAFIGSFIGVSLSMLSIQYTSTGIASTIIALVPVLIIVPSVIVFHEKVTFKEVIAAFIAVAGTAIFFL